jgi:internalin A
MQRPRMQEALDRINQMRRDKSSVLDLTGLSLDELPRDLNRLPRLRALHLSHNNLTVLPNSIGQLTQLTEIEVNNNQLKTLPESIGKLINLKALRVTDNQLAFLPESIGKLSNLQTLNLSGNSLTQLPPSIGKLIRLVGLYMHGNELMMLPETIGNLISLKDLIFANNSLAELPQNIGLLTSLVELNGAMNDLRALPDTIGGLTELLELNLFQNRLTALPQSIGQLLKLRVLNISENTLGSLPKSLCELNSLNCLFLHSNESLGLPLEVLGPTPSQVQLNNAAPSQPKNILDYYFRTRSGKRPLNEAKLILVGRGGVGKTSIVKRLLGKGFNRDEKKTEGINITEWKLKLKKKESVRLNIWDFGGQELMHATHQFFLTERSLYLLVLNGREGLEDFDADYWLRLIESFGGESPVIVVLNKIKDHAFDVNRLGYQQKYPAIRDFIKTDCEDGSGIEELRKVIERETDRLEHLRDAFPSSWFNIKNKLPGMTENYLTFGQYRKICAELGETDPKAQESLASYLHALGIALNYRDDPRLKATYVLNPHWVTNGIYRVLNSAKLEEQKGKIGLGDVCNILDCAVHPEEMHPFLFDLMDKFELCFSFSRHDYLIPELLDKQEPESAAFFKPEECLNFHYHYSVLPEGLLPRFIVRTHTLSKDQAWWRTGVILEFEGNAALVKADVQDKNVYISVSGPLRSRRRLLAIVRSHFEEIHANFKDLKVQAMVPLPDYPGKIIEYQKLVVMEQEGIKEFPEVVGQKIVQVYVDELLNGVDLDGTLKVRLFYSYSHRDERLRDELETHLKILQRLGVIETWHDRNIEASDDWKQQIDKNLDDADIILLLVSADFMASDYCYELEMMVALKEHDKGGVRVIPIILRPCNWKRAPFAKLQALPKDGKPITEWVNKDSAWTEVSKGIERLVEKIRGGKP